MFLLAGSLFGTWASRIPAYVEYFRLSEYRLGLLLLCIALGAILAFPFAGRLSDRIGAYRASRRLAGLYVVALGRWPAPQRSGRSEPALSCSGLRWAGWMSR